MSRDPYSLVCTFTSGVEIVCASGHDPVTVREAESRIARNPAAIARIELRDLTGPLETLWANTWDKATP